MLSDKTIKRDKKYSIFRRVVLAIRKHSSKKYRKILNDEIREKIKSAGKFTIFSNNCIGGVFYHDAGLEFTSPLINTAMDGEDFLKFLENPKHYLNCELKFITWPGRNYPIARIDDIEVNFVHYKDEEECLKKWNERKQRIIWDNIFVIATNHDGMCHEKCLKKFNNIDYQNKIMFVSKDYPEYDWAILIPQFKNRFQCRITTAFADMKGHRYYEKAFDLAEWIKINSKTDGKGDKSESSPNK